MRKTVDWSRAAKIARLLSSDSPGEVATAARKLIQLCGDVHVLAARLQGSGGGRTDQVQVQYEAYKRAARDFGAKPCQQCGVLFTGKETAKYCSSNCRVQAYRTRR